MSDKRRRLIELHKGKCAYCGAVCDVNVPVRMPTTEHRTPRARGGTDAWDNLALACFRCNSIKDAMTDDEFRHFASTGTLAASYVEYLTQAKLARWRAPTV